MTYQHIIWDWNGTLLDDVHLCIDIVNGLLKSHNNRQLDLDTYRTVFDFPILTYYQRVGFDFSIETFEALCDKFISTYHRRVVECGLQEGAVAILEALQQKGLQHSVLSAAEQKGLDMMVDKFRVRHFFGEVVGLSDNFARSKVENGKQLIQRLDMPPQQVLFIGDTYHDFEVAESIGVDCVLIPNGHHSIEKLKKSKAEILQNLSDLPTFLKL